MASNDALIGEKAPGISGRLALGHGLIKLRKLMVELEYERDESGKFKEVNGKYVLKIKRNVVVLNFFSTTCIPCVREIPTYNKIAEKFKDKPVKLIYVNVDSNVNPLEIRRFLARKRIKVPMMLPNQRDAIKKYNAYALPRLVIINKNGKVERVISGFSESLEEELTQLIENLSR